MQKKKVLFLFYRLPLNYKYSNDRRQFLIYSSVKEISDVKILTFGNRNLHNDDLEVVQLKRNNLKKIFNFLFKFQSPRLTHYSSKKYSSALKETILTFKPDIIYVEHLLMMQYIFHIETDAKIIFFNDESNLFIKANNLRGNLYQRLRNIKLAKLDEVACNRADTILTITKEEEKFYKTKNIKNIYTIPYGVDIKYFSFNWQKPKENIILFVGDFSHYPNRHTVRILSKDILPALTDLNIKLKIVGRNTDRIKRLITRQVEVYDNIEDVRHYYWNSGLFVAPIFSGAGLRVKILEAAICGLPLVISPIANMGINLESSKEAFICKSVIEFKEVLRDFFESKNDAKIEEMRLNARKRVSNEFNETIIKNKIISVFKTIDHAGSAFEK